MRNLALGSKGQHYEIEPAFLTDVYWTGYPEDWNKFPLPIAIGTGQVET